jgi:hypothetical protein
MIIEHVKAMAASTIASGPLLAPLHSLLNDAADPITLRAVLDYRIYGRKPGPFTVEWDAMRKHAHEKHDIHLPSLPRAHETRALERFDELVFALWNHPYVGFGGFPLYWRQIAREGARFYLRLPRAKVEITREFVHALRDEFHPGAVPSGDLPLLSAAPGNATPLEQWRIEIVTNRVLPRLSRLPVREWFVY